MEAIDHNIIPHFNIPIVLFTFVRDDKVLQIIDRVKKINPRKVYVISDGGRNEEEHNKIINCRKKIEERINWDCQIIKKYSSHNIGVFENIAGGVKWVFEREDFAIFLEDDNLPALTFFKFCEELLFKYKDDQRVLWICGTNYLQEYEPKNGSSYIFTKNMMPCGWASWKNKFTEYYDSHFSLWNEDIIKKRIAKEYLYKPLFNQDYTNWINERERFKKNGKYASWDYQMSWSIRIHDKYGIVPKYNQINNIGVDSHSIHGGISMDNIMTRRFCNIPTKDLEFPLCHPNKIIIDKTFEKRTSKIITYPFRMRFKIKVSSFLKKFFNIDKDASFSRELKKKIASIKFFK